MCTKQVNGKELTLVEIMARLEARKHQLHLIANKIVYSKQEIDSARIVLDRLLLVIPAAGSRDSSTVCPGKVQI